MLSKKQYIRELDSLRGIAALLIVILHFSTYLFPILGQEILNYTPILKRTYLFVDLFFILSGFVLAYNYYDSLSEKLTKKKYLVFQLKRLIKIYPLHLATLLLLVALIWGVEQNQYAIYPSGFSVLTNKTTLILNFFLLQSAGLLDGGCYDCTSWNYPAWSISVEWINYLIMPFLFIFIKKAPAAFRLLSPLLLAAVYFFIELPYGHLDYASWPGLLRCFAGVTIGINLFYYREKIPKLPSPGFIIVALILGLHFVLYDILIVVLLIAVVASTLQIKRHSWLAHSILQYLGKRSYSLYMVHAVVHLGLSFVYRKVFFANPGEIENLGFHILGTLFAIIITFILAEITYRIFEISLHKRLKRLLID